MLLADFIFIVRWWLLFFLIGIIFLPITILIFPKFIDKGYIFSKIIGVLVISYTIFFLGIFKILPFINLTTLIIILFSLLVNIYIAKRIKLLQYLQNFLKIFIFEELLFFSVLVFWAFVRAYLPDIHGLEKYMDFGFVNSILRSNYFPPKDMWFTPLPINYYYFGHLVTAVLTKLSDIPSSITYNLMLATLAAFTFTGSFSIGISLLNNFKFHPFGKLRTRISNFKFQIFLGGLLTGFLVTFAGNLHTLYTFFKPYVNENPQPFWQLPLSVLNFPNSYWYPNATRFIYNTIHEFPVYSFVVSDLHGHVLDIPVVLLTIAVLFSLIQKSKIKNQNHSSKFKIFNSKLFYGAGSGFARQFFTFHFSLFTLLLGFLLAIMYMTNVWDGIIYLILTSIIIILLRIKRNIPYTVYYIPILALVFILFALPFSLNFKPFVSGIGILCAPPLLTNIGKIGPFLFEADHCQKSPLWQMAILYGFFYFWAVLFILKLKTESAKLKTTAKNLKLLKLKIKNLHTSDLFVLILILISTLLIILPEFIYAKDIYPAHYRANTMFKLVYQSFIMLSIASGYIIVRIITNIKYPISNIQLIGNLKFGIGIYLKFIMFIIGFIGLFLVSIYPYFSITSYYGNLQTYRGLDGTSYLKTQYPDDYEAIKWLNRNIKKQPVILEAQGDSYTDYARVSTNTGLPTVLGWTVHEWLWRGTYNVPAPRITEIQTLYESDDLLKTKNLIKKYNIQLVFIGNLERQKYKNLNTKKFDVLGKIIFQSNNSKIYKIY